MKEGMKMRKNLDMAKSPAFKIAGLIRNDASIDCVEVTVEMVTFYTDRQDVMDILFPKPQPKYLKPWPASWGEEHYDIWA